MKQLSIIVVLAEDNAIGLNNRLLYHLPEDLRRFKKITLGHTVIMGRNTYFSLPNRPLPGRVNMVISDNPEERLDGCVMASSIMDAIEKCPEGEESFVMGGASVYRQFLPHASGLYLTRIYAHFKADVWFPEINYDEWELVEKQEGSPDKPVPFSYEFQVYRRKKT